MTAVHNHLPDVRRSVTRRFRVPVTNHEGKVDELKIYVIAGIYEDGKLGEIFIRAAKLGTFESGMLDGFAMAVSVGLQHGVPLVALTAKMRHTRFEPAGWLDKDSKYKSCSSILDLIARWLDDEFGPKPVSSQADTSA